ncbi:unnamed protein product [Mytilus coruscus]|uniref:DDE Tnp4 domain-containing protein n=1 Tax=Mytilus coruscus TaxID=42192 RepID=A0A6J8A867_MYTCO|nr:unnamed protein product [Mytilus coruscus]
MCSEDDIESPFENLESSPLTDSEIEINYREYTGIVLKGEKIVIPTSLRDEMMKRLHEIHLGIENQGLCFSTELLPLNIDTESLLSLRVRRKAYQARVMRITCTSLTTSTCRKKEGFNDDEVFSSQETIKELSDRFGVTEHSFIRSKRQDIETICDNLLSKFIVWPQNNDFQHISQRFDDLGTRNFPGILGAINGSHIQIEAPLHNPKSYFNRKQFHSVVLQGWPGHVHDAKVFRNSGLYENGFQKCGNGRYHLLGDAAYPLKEWLLTPYRDNGHLSQQQTRFNVALSSKRQVIERCFGMLKGRSIRLKYINMKSMREICQTIIACCILHNICIIEHDIIEEILNDVVVPAQNFVPGIAGLFENDAQGQLKRMNITNRI